MRRKVDGTRPWHCPSSTNIGTSDRRIFTKPLSWDVLTCLRARRKVLMISDRRLFLVLRKLGVESPLQLAVILCVTSLIVVTTLGGSGGAPEIFLTYRTLLIVVAILCAIGCRSVDVQISRWFLKLVAFF